MDSLKVIAEPQVEELNQTELGSVSTNPEEVIQVGESEEAVGVGNDSNNSLANVEMMGG